MLIGNNLGTFIKQEKAKRRVINNLAFCFVPRPGIEPGWIAPLVFETSASTDSAIWACVCGCKYTASFGFDQRNRGLFFDETIFVLAIEAKGDRGEV